jgi:hypothetical protein
LTATHKLLQVEKDTAAALGGGFKEKVGTPAEAEGAKGKER